MEASAGRAGSCKKKKIGEGAFSNFFYQNPLVPHPLFRLSPLTESLEQAGDKFEGFEDAEFETAWRYTFAHIRNKQVSAPFPI